MGNSYLGAEKPPDEVRRLYLEAFGLPPDPPTPAP